LKIDKLLYVGCGFRPFGSVNLDLFPEPRLEHTRGSGGKPIALPVHHIRNFIKADAQHLPFKDNAFEHVFSAHTIEHVSDPALMLRELVRVSNYRITVKCPHKLGDQGTKKYHLSKFDGKWFLRNAKKVNCSCRVDYTKMKSFPHWIFPLFQVPYEITAWLLKGE
jgi:SAM-dependent methyltransferase